MRTLLLTAIAVVTATLAPAQVLDIGSRRELFVDDLLIAGLAGGARQQLHQPRPQELTLVHDAPWEGSGTGYHSVFYDGKKYRLYYKAWHLAVTEKGVNTGTHPLYACYAESPDGIHWTKPELGLVEFKGSKANNIVLAPGQVGSVNPDPGHLAVFMDDNPACDPAARFKAIFRSNKPHGLLPFASADGLHWRPLTEKPAITHGAFDSQNLAFWDGAHGVYRAYWRYFTSGSTDGENWKPSGDRAIRTAVSKDFITWTDEKDLVYVDSPPEQLYTNVVKPYERAPHLLLGFPARYIERGWNASMEALPELEHRRMRGKASPRYGMAVTEGLFMASRDGVTFKRWNDAFLPPGPERAGSWNYGHQYIAWHPVRTKSTLEGAPDELSLYATESYWTGDSSALRRYTLRMDGFVSIRAPRSGGTLTTRPFTFQGKGLELNMATSAAGQMRVEIQDAQGRPLPGFSLSDCEPVYGDSLDRRVVWKGSPDLAAHAGKPVRLFVELQDADWYAFRFVP